MQERIRPVVWVSYKNERCVSCGASLDRGDLIVMNREQGIRCLTCAGLGGLVLLPAGDVALTRRALAHSVRSAVAVKHSRARHRNERQGVLVEESAIERAESENAQDEARREAQRQERRVRDQVAEQRYVADFAASVLELFPGAPPAETKVIAARADRLRAKGMEPAEARAIVRPAIEKVLAGWMAAGSR